MNDLVKVALKCELAGNRTNHDFQLQVYRQCQITALWGALGPNISWAVSNVQILPPCTVSFGALVVG